MLFWAKTDYTLTWFLVHDLPGVVEVGVPVVPLPAGEAQLPAGHTHVCLGPVPAVGAHRPPEVSFQDLDDALVDAGAVNQPDGPVGSLAVNLAVGRYEPER